MHELNCSPDGFEWIDANDSQQSTMAFLRKSKNPADTVLVVYNFTPVVRYGYKVGVPAAGFWAEILNSDAAEYGGSGVGNLGGTEASEEPAHGRKYSLNITLPPLAALFFKLRG